MTTSSRLSDCQRTAGTLTLIGYKFVVRESRLAALRDANAAPVSVSLIKKGAETSFLIPPRINHNLAEN